jgi:hypothetical protein
MPISAASDLISVHLMDHTSNMFTIWIKKFETFQLEPRTFLSDVSDRQLHAEKRFVEEARGKRGEGNKLVNKNLKRCTPPSQNLAKN